MGWSGCNSALETLDADLPIVTLPGDLMRSRDASAILNMIGVQETIASDVDEYVAIAARLGQDRAWRGSVAAKIASNKHRVYRDRSCIAALEAFLESAVYERLNNDIQNR
jgi:protein O-GlcNAc transferase